MIKNDSHLYSCNACGIGAPSLAMLYICSTLNLLVSSADNLCKQIGPRSGSKIMFDTVMLLKTLILRGKKFQQTTKKKKTKIIEHGVKF